MHGSPDVGNESESEIADNESSDLHMVSSSCSKATSALHTQHKPCSAGQTTTDIAQCSHIFPVQPTTCWHSVSKNDLW